MTESGEASTHDHDEQPWQEQLRASGYRLTAQRELVLSAVEALGHATPEEVYGEVRRHSSAVNLSTVYRTLDLLDELGLIKHAHIEDRTPTYHSTRGHEHFHLVCHRCRTIISLDADRASSFVGQAERDHGFAVDVGHLTVFGICASCQESGVAADGSP